MKKSFGTCSSPAAAAKPVRRYTRQEDVGAAVHQPPREADRRPRRLDPGDRARVAALAFHDRRIELDFAASVSTLPRPALKQGSSSRLRAAASTASIALPPFASDCRAGGKRCFESGAGARFVRGIVMRDPLRARAAMNHQSPALSGHGRAISGALCRTPVDSPHSIYNYDIN